MGKYLKLFETDSARVEYEGSENYLEPYVSYVEGDNTVHYNKPKETRVVATFNVTSTSEPTRLFIGMKSMGFPASAIYDKIEIDDAEIDMSDLSSSEQGGATFYGYNFEIDGRHTVKYTLKDPTMIGAEFDEQTHTITRLGATFVNCPITSVEIPNSVTSIGQAAFNSCASLTSVTIPNSVTSIGDGAFYDCSGLTTVTIPNSVTSIGGSAFQNCSGLISVTIPNSVTSIGGNAFNTCGNLTSITVESTTPPTLEGGAFFYTNDCPIYVPSTSVETYKEASGWSDYTSRIQAIP